MKKFLNGKLGLLSVLGLLASSSQAFAWGGWAVIVFDQYGHWRSHHGAYSHAEATRAALANATNLQGPYRETYVHNGWVALARCYNDGANHWAGDHSSQEASEQDALRHCGYSYDAATGSYYPNGYVVRSLASYDFQEDQSGTDTGTGF